MQRFQIDPQDWAELSRLLDTALELPAAEREAWLESLDARHAPLRAHLRDLLACAARIETGDFLNTLPKLDGAPELAAPSDRESARVGPYRLIRELGAGGMGSVWLAERTDGLVKRPVALKLPHVAAHRVGLAERMAREREILAALAHPNIARLYDAGVTSEGRPYLALEYIEGRPIDAYCNEKGLDARGRLELFLQVAKAVAYAHAKLIIHRDLKPANILVTGEAEVRLLDFGLAKLLDAGEARATQLTELSGRAMTLDYASPEQILDEPLTITTDVYSLGVVLYELLTGAKPYRLARDTRAALEEAILRTEPKRPSEASSHANRGALRGDLDTIALKALKKAPIERYPTVNAFAEDIERYLARQPILARPDSVGYRLTKFVSRHRYAATITSLVLAAIIASAVIAVQQAREARVQRDLALQQKARADDEAAAAAVSLRVANANTELTNYLTADLAIGRSTTELEQQLERAIKVVNIQYADDGLVRLRLLIGLAGRFRQLANFARHRELVGELEPLAQRLGDADTLAQIRCWRARDLSQNGQLEAARTLVDGVLAELRNRTPPIGILCSCLADASAIARLAGDSARALAAIEEVRRLEAGAGLARTETHAETLLVLTRAYAQAGRFREAAAVATLSLELRRQIGKDDTPGMANMLIIYASALREGGRPDQAVRLLERDRERHLARRGTLESVPAAEYEWGVALLKGGRDADALEVLERVHVNAKQRSDATVVRASSVGRVLANANLGRLERAQALLRELGSLYAALLSQRQYPARLYLLAKAHVALAARDAASAAAALRDGRALMEQTAAATDPSWRQYRSYAAQLALLERRFQDAQAEIAAALEISQRQAIDAEASVFVAEDLLLRARIAAAMGDTDAASRDASLAVRHFEQAASSHPGMKTALRWARLP